MKQNKKILPDIFIRTYGCASNRFDSQQLTFDLINNNFFVYNQSFGSDKQFFRDKYESFIASKVKIFIIHTCPITSYLEKLTNEFIKYLQKINKKAKIILTGCSTRYKYSLLKRKNILNSKNLVIIDLDKIPYYLSKRRGQTSKCEVEFNHFEPGTVLIKKGCNKYCTYCICPRICKKFRCLTFQEILSQIRQLKSWQFKSIEFAGPCIGDWHDPFDNSLTFFDLVKHILEQTDFRITNLELHPSDVPNELIYFLKSEKINREISIPIQSGSDRILQIMNRRYNVAYLKKIFKKLFTKIPDLRLTTDIIVGFPGESEKDFKKTINFLKQFPFFQIDVYSYSPRKGAVVSSRRRIKVEDIRRRISRLKEDRILQKIINITSL